jgi:hypothetical protein
VTVCRALAEARSRRLLAAAILALLSGACATRRITLPQDAGMPMADAAAVHAMVSSSCRGIRTFTAELALSARVGSQRLRGRVIAGFDRAGSMRLEGVAPFGPPAFVLAARPEEAVLLLPRDERVLRHPESRDVLGALSGVPLAPADLLAVLTGCVVQDPTPAAGRLHERGWASIDLGGEATIYLQRIANAWQVRAARRAPWEIEYDQWLGGLPRVVRLRTLQGQAPVDATLQVSEVETNVDLPATAFTVAVPPNTAELTLEELRRAGPLRGQ